MSPPLRQARGFTLTELVAVMVVAVIIAVFTVTVFDRRSFDAAGFADEVRAQLAYAQKVAVGARRIVTATVSGNTVALTMCTGFPVCGSTVPVASPQGESDFVRQAPGGVSIGPDAVLSFDPLGKPSAGALFTVSGGGSAHHVIVEAGTGYVH